MLSSACPGITWPRSISSKRAWAGSAATRTPALRDLYGDGDINNTHDAILAAARYLHAVGAPKKIEKAIWMYNHDNEYVDAVMKYAEVMRIDPSAYREFCGR